MLFDFQGDYMWCNMPKPRSSDLNSIPSYYIVK